MNKAAAEASLPTKAASILRVAAIRFLNPAPLMWDFEHEPGQSSLAARYRIEWMMPSACADRLALPIDRPDAADLGLVPIAALASTPGLTVVPGCAIAAKRRVRSILLVRRAHQPVAAIRTVAADASSRASRAYVEILFRAWGNTSAAFVPHFPDLDPMLEFADAAMLIGDPALYALEERNNREERTGEELVYHDLAEEWIKLTGLPWVSAVWAIRDNALTNSGLTLDQVAADFTASRDRGLANIEALAAEWSARVPIPASTIREYLTANIHYFLDGECRQGMERFFELASQADLLPAYKPQIAE